VEGKYYVWTKEEIEAILGDEAEAFCENYQVTAQGNWEHGVNILWKYEPTLNEKFKVQIAKLNTIRNTRIRPGLDDKILCSWNALMLKGLVDAYRVFDDESFLTLAVQNAHFIKDKFLVGEQLMHSYKNGETKIQGFLEDYAALIDAYLNLYQATFDETWLHYSEKLTLYTFQNFWDEEDELFSLLIKMRRN